MKWQILCGIWKEKYADFILEIKLNQKNHDKFWTFHLTNEQEVYI